MISGAGLLVLLIALPAFGQNIYRGMRQDPANNAVPQVANTALGLGVRDTDVVANDQGLIAPDNPNTNTPQGTSVVTGAAAADACTLPPFSRPAGNNWNGTGNATVRVWAMATANLPAALQVQAAPVAGAPNHAVISTTGNGATLVDFRAEVAGIQAHWAEVAPPAAPCP